MNYAFVLIPQNLISFDGFMESEDFADSITTSPSHVGTLISNFAYYGYKMSDEMLSLVFKMDQDAMARFWMEVEPEFKRMTGEFLNAESFVLYRNFPQEVMDMSEGEYWIRQIMVYLGYPHNFVRQSKMPRTPININQEFLRNLDTLHVCHDEDAFIAQTKQDLISMKTSWTRDQYNTIINIFEAEGESCMDISEYGFKTNALKIIMKEVTRDPSIEIVIPDATDVLRLCALMRDAKDNHIINADLKKMRFGKMSRPMRRKILSMLEMSKNLEEDASMRQTEFKRLLSYLHPNDFKFKRVSAVYDKLYNDKLKSYNSLIETSILNKDDSVLTMLENRTGDLIRRFHKLYDVFGRKAVDTLIHNMDNIETQKLISFKSYISQINTKEELIFPHGGSWKNPKIAVNQKVKISDDDLSDMVSAIDKIVAKRVVGLMGSGFSFDESLKRIKLQANDQEFASYGRGTSFDIPEDSQFARTMSFWSNDTSCYIDNSISVFTDEWDHISDCCWNSERADGLVFSGDASNSQNCGMAAQFIDINFDELRKNKARYVVMTMLSFNHLPFANLKEVYYGLQFGDDQFSGKIFEPSRVEMSFELKSDSLSNVVAYIDLKENTLVYLDLPLYLSVSSITHSSSNKLQTLMPNLKEMVSQSPSLYDLLEGAYQEDGIPAVYTDKDSPVIADKGFIFLPKHTDSKVEEMVSITSLSNA